MNSFKSTIFTLLGLGVALCASGTAGAVTVSGDYLADDAGSGCSAGGNFDCTDTLLSIGDAVQTRISGNAGDGGGSFTFAFTASEPLSAVEFNTVNPLTGFVGAEVEWNTAEDGSGTTLAFLTNAQILLSQSMQVAFLADQTLYLIATWTDVARNASSFDLRVEAIPIPPALLLFGTALAGIGFLGRRRRKLLTGVPE
jgi:hypothetical protein